MLDVRLAAFNVHVLKVGHPSYVDMVLEGYFKIKNGVLRVSIHPEAPLKYVRFDFLTKFYESGDVFEIHCFKDIYYLNDIKKGRNRNLLKLVIS